MCVGRRAWLAGGGLRRHLENRRSSPRTLDRARHDRGHRVVSVEDDPHPRGTTLLCGHVDAERQLLAAYAGGRIPHAWLIGGEPGIGKATLAYRMARFVLAHPDPAGRDVQTADSLFVAPD